ncbi:asparagine synthetase [Patescibacteria group bacterium]|nr:asparagine synthetase [Patescibacteria group bacterium]MBU1673951.1 asparagine synthetase [Patescibacteria group bacterium]MBU1963945.1 asparagine synthetase [Patescibacteria group bacterium]
MKSTTKKLISHLTDPQVISIAKLQSQVLATIHGYFRKKGFIEIPPVILSPLTDPLAHPVHEARVEYEGQALEITKSMIFHKQLALMEGKIRKIYCVSPNVRLEPSKEAKDRHLIEFHQIDFEIYRGKKKDVYKLMEGLFKQLIPDIKTPFPRGKKSKTTPYWLEGFEREFYDKETANYDLYYPKLGEGLSGGERETDYKTILKKMKDRKMDLKPYEIYLDIAKAGKLPPSAGAGLGLQRLMRYLGGVKEIEKTTLFPRSPRGKILF